MTGPGLDHRFTFDTFIVGTANRLSAAAARRVAEAPAKSYNPLFIYGASGLGKTHLLHAIGVHALTLQPAMRVSIDTVERAVQRLPEEGGEGDLATVQLLLLDDVQYLAGDRRAQDTLLAWWDELGARGVQIVLGADRPPSEIDRLDHRLLSRFSAGLVCDMAPPDYETRVQLVHRKASDRGHTFGDGVPEAIARVAFANVRELEGGVNRVIAAQELDGTPVTAGGVDSLLGQASERGDSEEFDAFLTEVAGAVAEIATRVTPEQRLVDAILRYEGEGYRTYRLEVALRHPPGEREVIELVDRFAADAIRLNAIMDEIRAMDVDAPELARADLLRNPDRVLEAETLVAQVHERLRPLPEPPPGPGFAGLTVSPDSPALNAAKAVLRRPGARAVPLYVRGSPGQGRSAVVQALAREVRTEMPRLPVAYVRAGDLAAEAVAAELAQRIDAWRGRYRRARLLVIDEFDRLDASDEVRDELYRLFDGVGRSGGQVVLAGELDPGKSGMTDRLATWAAQADIADVVGDGSRQADGPEPEAFGPDLRDKWFLDREKTLERWPWVEDWLMTELD
jgi:chromosomal replication initiation ATPase DnaA